MTFNTKINLNSNKIEQCSGEVLNLSGCTQIYGQFRILNPTGFTSSLNAGVGKVWTSDAFGNGSWQTGSSGSTSGNITGVTNGLNINSTKQVGLGGTLTGNTIIDLKGTNLNIYNLINSTGITIGSGFNDNVRSIAIQNNGKILISGQFITYSGVSENEVVRLNSNGSLDNTFIIGSGFNDIPWKALIQTGDSKIILIGQFITYSGVSRNGIVRLNTDGSIDNTFIIGTGFDSAAFTGAIQNDGKILIGGQFSSYSGVSRNGIARLNSDGSLDNTFIIGIGLNGATANAIEIQTDGKILLGGGFNSYSGISANNIARLNSDGSLDYTFNSGDGFNNNVYSIAIQSDGKILVGGDFNSYSGVSVSRIIRLNTDGSLDNTFITGSGFDNIVYTIAIQSDNKILIGGQFSSYSGVTSNKIIRLNTDGSVDNTFITGSGFDNNVYTIAIQTDSKILLGGGFTSYNNTISNRLIRLNIDGSLDISLSFNIIFNGKVIEYGADYSVNYTDRSLVDKGYVNNKIQTCGGIGWSNLDNGSTVAGCGTVASGGTICNNTFYGVCAGKNITYGYGNVGIGFQTLKANTNGRTNIAIGLQALSSNTNGCSNIALGNGALFSNISGNNNIGIGNSVLVNNFIGNNNIAFGACALTVNGCDNNIALSALALYSNSCGSNNLAIGKESLYNNVSGNTNIAIGYQAGYNETGSNKLYISNSCTANPLIYGEFDNKYLKLTSKVDMVGDIFYNGFSTGSGFSGGAVKSVTIQSNNKILVGGEFTTYSGVTANKIIRLNSNGSIDNTFVSGSGFNDRILSIALQSDSKILLGGSFTTYSGTTANRIIRLNSDGTIDNTFISGIGFDGAVNSIVIQSGDSKIVIGGEYNSYSGVTIHKIIRLNSDGTIDNTFVNGSGFDFAVNSIVLQSDSKILLGGVFTTYSGVTANKIIRLNSNGSIDNTFVSGSGFNSYVNSIALQSDSKILLGGSFTTYSGTTANRIIRLNSDSTIDNTFISGIGFDSIAYSIAIQSDSKIVIGGLFTSYSGVTANEIIRLGSDGSIDNTFNSDGGFSFGIYSLVLQSDNKILVGGEFNSYSGVTANEIIRLNSDGSIDSPIPYTATFNGKVIEYGADYSVNYTDRSLVDKGYVLSVTSGSSGGGIGWSNATNGSTVAGCGTLPSGGTSCNNTIYGVNAGCSITTGCNNVAIGVQALRSNDIGERNIAIGWSALISNTLGCDNTSIGYGALYSNTIGNDNIAIGDNALTFNVCGNCNIAFGHNSLASNVSGCNNVAQGFFALACNITGQNNVAVGQSSLQNNLCGIGNVGIGFQSIVHNTNGCYNTAFGSCTLFNSFTTSYNTAIGYGALYAATGGTANIAIGYQAHFNGNNGSCNVAIGCQAAYCNKIGISNIAIGTQALYASTGGTNNIAIGVCALRDGTCSSMDNIAIGIQTLLKNKTGESNIAIGRYSMSNCIVCGTVNIGIGQYALCNLTTGDANTGIGGSSLAAVTSGSYNTAIGYNSLPNVITGTYNTALGSNSFGQLTGGTNNIGIGCSIFSNLRCGNNNIGIGNTVGHANINSSFNTVIGASAGFNASGSCNVIIGACAGYNAVGSNKLHIANCGSCTLICGDFVAKTVCIDAAVSVVSLTCSSDERLKTNIKPITIEPVNVKYRQFVHISSPNQLKYGVIAQELQGVNPELVRTDDNGMLSVEYNDLYAKEIAYLKWKVSELDEKLNNLIENNFK